MAKLLGYIMGGTLGLLFINIIAGIIVGIIGTVITFSGESLPIPYLIYLHIAIVVFILAR